MNDIPNKSKHKSDIDLAQLQSNLRRSESLRGGLTALTARNSDRERYTIGDHDSTPVAKRSLVLSLDPEGNAAPPEGATLVCRGTAYVSDAEQAVAVFRTAGS